MSGSAFAVTHHAFSSGAGRTSDGNGSHASTLKSPSYTKSVSWQHYQVIGGNSLCKFFITRDRVRIQSIGFAPIFPDICYHLTHYKPAAADIPVASDNPAHYADAIRYNARTPLQGSLLPLTRLVWA